jgi:molybdopterin synthase catalytic subunit
VEPPADNRAQAEWIDITTEVMPVAAAVEWAVTPAAGGVVLFSGVVREESEGRDDVTALTYEAYDDVARAKMQEIAVAARQQWPSITRVVLLHRIGRVARSESSVLVVVAAPHRGDAFDAARYCIDTLKESVPIWKQEHWSGGADWSANEATIKPVAS